MNKVTRIGKDEIIKELNSVVTDDTNFNYIGVYESDNKDNSVTLKLKESKYPAVLLLQSHRAVVWKIDNSAKVDIKAIVINSSTPESEVRGETKGIKIIYSQRAVGHGYSSGLPDQKRKKECKCIVGHYTCSETRAFGANDIPSKFAQKASGFSGKYAATTLEVPEVQMKPEIYEEIERRNAEIREGKQLCTKNQTLTPDKLFD